MFRGKRSHARRRWSLTLVSLTIFVLLLPLTLSKPGIPTVLKADEAAYYLGALSLWHDGDFECDDSDARRLFREYAGTSNLLLMRSGPEHPVYFSVPIPYPLLATPFAAFLGANGLVFLNALLLMAMVWMGFDFLRHSNSDSVSLLFTVGYFLLSTALVYVFWLQAEIFNMACLMASFYLVDRVTREHQVHDPPQLPVEFPLLGASAAGAFLAVVCYSKPMFVLLAVPLLYRLLKARAWRGLTGFIASGVLAGSLLLIIAYGLTDQIWPYFAPRAGISLSSPVDYIERRVAPRLESSVDAAPSAVGQLKRGGHQLRVTIGSIVRESAPEFLFGRHGGFFIYMPFAALSILLFLINDRRSIFRWLLLAAAAMTAAVFLAGVRGQWLGGGGFIGNRYFLPAYPAFFFLVRQVRPAWLTACGYGAAAILLGPLLITPLGAMVREPTLQAHVRNQPYPRLPLEWSLIDSLSGYRYVRQVGATFHGRADEIVPHDEELWVHGAKRVEVSLLSRRELPRFVLGVRSIAFENRITICLERDCRRLDFAGVPPDGTTSRVVFEPRSAVPIPRPGKYGPRFRYSLTITSEWGEQPRWRGSGDESFYVGAAIALLGSAEDLERDLFAVEWLRVDAPSSIPSGSTVSVPVELRNVSAHSWPSRGAARVRLSYHWLSEDGESILWNGRRTELPADLGPGRSASAELLVTAPDSPGRYVLALDLVRERVSWFSRKRDDVLHRRSLSVTARDSEQPPAEGG